ncbi:uncharacterized protein B0H64DRAFT_322670 [Chaetomium fimeti]|uniref:YMC020W-like alpha/beta hydrolase domain-containing protein n=1 Tax=Chaetomium fimeti TaxID=1854472 RepID=A0AAE0HG35_9PEZI|nr:hypothetical protein B0H64DRAFT_322670 [Chaetomium fimeti]
MGSRKRVKPNPVADSNTSTPIPTPTPTPASSTMPSQSSSKSSKSSTSTADRPTPTSPATSGTSRTSTLNGSGGGSKQACGLAHKARSWYGSWPRVPKSVASTQVARETILGGTSKPAGTADFSRFEQKKPVDTMSIHDASVSTVSKIEEDAASTGQQPSDPTPPVAESVTKPEDKPKPERADTEMADAGHEDGRTEPPAEQPAEQPADAQAGETVTDSTPPRPASGWFGWLGRPGATVPIPPVDPTTSDPSPQAANVPTAAEVKAPDVKAPEADKEVQAVQEGPVVSGTAGQPESKPAASYGSSWLWSWSGRTAPAPSQPETVSPTVEPEAPPPAAKEPEDVVMQDAPNVEIVPEAPTPSAAPAPAPTPKAGSTWAFWSRDTKSAATKKPVQPQSEQGQLAVMGESSETHPQKANPMELKNTPAKEPPLKSGRKEEPSKAAVTPSRESSSRSNKRGRPKSMEVDDAAPVRPGTPKVDKTSKASAPKTPTKIQPPNLLLPSFDGTYKFKENSSILKQIAQLLLRTQQPAGKHVYLAKEPPKIKKAIAIGVHGLFPANYLRPMIGQPTGTSIKFANHCAEAIRRWADSHGCEDCEIEKVALEGEGKIGERVENLWKLLLNWIDLIRKADLILIGCHSQGVPVSIMLLAKLIELGVVASAKVGVCAMAGVSLGPFPDYRSSMGILMGTAAELWEFADPQSEVSKRLEASTTAVLNYGARLTYIGSIDDQLVPLESAIYAPVHHPYIYRAVFIDGRIHAPDFIAHLVGFALKLRNLGVSDHGLIRELSTPLAGSLYSGEGHSRLYDDERVYDLAVTHALETTDVDGACEVVHHRRGGGGGDGSGSGSGGSGSGSGGGGGSGSAGLSNPNPYHLPWIMRGLLEEDFVKTELSAETAELVRQFDDWKPVTKALKDVKYRLEAVRSKL